MGSCGAVLERQPINYSLIFSKKRRTIAIHVKAQSVSVRAPHGACKRFIDDFVLSKRTWIETQLLKQSDFTSQVTKPLQDNKVMLFGEWVNIKVSRGKRSQTICEMGAVEFVIAHRVSQVSSKAKDMLLAYLSQSLTVYVNERIAYWQNEMGVTASDVKVRTYKRRWGSCNQRRELSFNTFLVGAPKWVIDYVIVHELAHIRHMDHSNAFWQFVETKYAYTNQAKAWLKENGHKLELRFE